ncbi:MAG TPA: hypothetical protein VHE30_26435 [Polyangiaceae bacterium]|nr:hypothetical protein [Polyangiaceae bacterium]
MRFFRLAASLVLVGSAAAVACSSDSNEKTTGSQHPGDSGAGGGDNGGASSGGKGGGSSTGGKSSSGGAQGSGGSADAGPKTCPPDAGPDKCRPCLTDHCNDDYTACTGEATCSDKFDAYQDCVHCAAGEANQISECFSSFAGDTAAQHAKLTTCIYNSCSIECGGPIPL